MKILKQIKEKIRNVDFKKLSHVNLISLLGLDRVQKQLIFAVAVATVIVLNLVVAPLSLRLDLSQGQAYTLSDSTKNILKNVDDVVNIKFFVSSDLPTQVAPLKTDVKDLLSEYDRASDKLHVNTVDPKLSDSAQEEANEVGIKELQFSQMDRDEFAVKTGYFGLVIYYGDEKEVVSQVGEIGDLEYNLTSAIYKLTKKEAINVAIMGQADVDLPPDISAQLGQQMPQSKLQIFREELKKQYEVEQLNISTESSSIDEKYKTVLVFDDGMKSYDGQEIEALKKYIKNKGKAIFFVDGVWTNEQQGLTTASASSNLRELVGQYGVNVKENLVLSEAAELVNLGSADGGFPVIRPYPFWIRTNNFAKDSPYFSNVNQAIYAWTSSITLDEEKNGYKTKDLIKTVGRSWEQKDDFVLLPDSIPSPEEDDFKEFILAAQAENNKGSKVIVIPSSRFLLDQFVQRSEGNINFILNVVSDFASGGALSGIRKRVVNFYPLPEMPKMQQDVFKYANILLLPAFFGIFGAMRLMKRKEG